MRAVYYCITIENYEKIFYATAMRCHRFVEHKYRGDIDALFAVLICATYLAVMWLARLGRLSRCGATHKLSGVVGRGALLEIFM